MNPQPAAPLDGIEQDLVLEAIWRRHHYDFRGYARDTMARRLAHAQQRFGCETLSALQERVLHDPAILAPLLDVLTIQVSEMFRDPEHFLALREQVIPHLATYPSIKVWVAGCGAGEELYSLAILFREEGLERKTVFYATDLNSHALKKAEAGIYPLERVAAFTENHRRSGGRSSLSDHYTAAYGAAVFDRTLRERTVFAEHSLVSDHVFAEVQLVSCRNVLIYFGRSLQDRALGLFAEALPHGGFLALGSRETPRFSSHAAAFADFGGPQRIYRRMAPALAGRERGHAA